MGTRHSSEISGHTVHVKPLGIGGLELNLLKPPRKVKAILAGGFSPVSTFDAGSSCLKSWVARLRHGLLKLYEIAGLEFWIGVFPGCFEIVLLGASGFWASLFREVSEAPMIRVVASRIASMPRRSGPDVPDPKP